MRCIVKICGVRTEAGADAVAASGADLAGLLLVPGRRRAIDLERASTLIPRLLPVEPVGVFLDASLETILHAARTLGLRTVQLHGSERPALGLALLQEGLRVIRALSVRGAVDEALFAPHRAYASAFLLDAPSPGSGHRIPLAALQLGPRAHGPDGPDRPDRPDRPDGPPASFLAALAGRPVWLAGGLDPDNVAAALHETGATGVDVASGIEVSGEPCPIRIQAFVAAARAASAQMLGDGRPSDGRPTVERHGDHGPGDQGRDGGGRPSSAGSFLPDTLLGETS